MTTRRSSGGGNGIAKRMGEQGRLGVPFGDDWEELHAGMLVLVRLGTVGTAGWSPMAVWGNAVIRGANRLGTGHLGTGRKDN